nr:MAG TPA: hypothetical protein [Caudoviricetes sp.]
MGILENCLKFSNFIWVGMGLVVGGQPHLFLVIIKMLHGISARFCLNFGHRKGNRVRFRLIINIYLQIQGNS